jgi:formate hydrogenlyase subunit 6/NADH:ubiquinone oxidoreductase subunit I
MRQAAYGKRLVGSHLLWRADGSCSGCEACINWCPTGAIQYEGGKTEAKGRYHHPGIALAEIASQRKR